MKPKKLKGKLSLNKKTVANLSSGQLGYVKAGGPPPTEFPCDPETLRITFCTPTCETCATCVSCATCGNFVTCYPGGGCTFKGTCPPECGYPDTL